jgi:hypothetical protein
MYKEQLATALGRRRPSYLKVLPHFREEPRPDPNKQFTPEELLAYVLEDDGLSSVETLQERRDHFNRQLTRILSEDEECRDAFGKAWNGRSRARLHQLLETISCLLESNQILPLLDEKNQRHLSTAQIAGWTGGSGLGKCWNRYQVLWTDSSVRWITDKGMQLKLEDEALLITEILRAPFTPTSEDIKRMVLFHEVQGQIRHSAGKLPRLVDWEKIDKTLALMKRRAIERHNQRRRIQYEEMAAEREAQRAEREEQAAKKKSRKKASKAD